MPDPFSELQKRAGGKLFIAAEPDLLFWLIFHKHGCLTEAYVNISIEKLKKQEGDFFLFYIPSCFCPRADERCRNTVAFIIYKRLWKKWNNTACTPTHTHTQCKHTQYKEREWSISRFRLKKTHYNLRMSYDKLYILTTYPFPALPLGDKGTDMLLENKIVK